MSQEKLFKRWMECLESNQTPPDVFEELIAERDSLIDSSEAQRAELRLTVKDWGGINKDQIKDAKATYCLDPTTIDNITTAIEHDQCVSLDMSVDSICSQLVLRKRVAESLEKLEIQNKAERITLMETLKQNIISVRLIERQIQNIKESIAYLGKIVGTYESILGAKPLRLELQANGEASIWGGDDGRADTVIGRRRWKESGGEVVVSDPVKGAEIYRFNPAPDKAGRFDSLTMIATVMNGRRDPVPKIILQKSNSTLPLKRD